MDAKSIEIVKKIASLLESKQMSLASFPKNDIIDMFNASYLEEREKKDKEWAETMAYLKQLFSEVVENKNVDDMLEVLGTISSETCNWHEYAERKLITNRYKKKAKEVYEKSHSNSAEIKNGFQGKGVIYTVITGGYDVLQEPEVFDNDFQYICFTNNPDLKSSVWEIRMMENEEQLDDVRLARKYKVLCYEYLKEFDYSIYIDGKIKIIGDVKAYINQYSKGSAMLCFPHFVRDCAYQEALACIQFGKDSVDIISKQMEVYNEEGYPINNGLIDSACLVRSHRNEELQNALAIWWNEIKNKSRRDQLSFGYACWKAGITYDICDLFIYDNPYICKRRTWEAPY